MMWYIKNTKFFLKKICRAHDISRAHNIIFYIKAIGVSYSCHYFDVYSFVVVV